MGVTEYDIKELVYNYLLANVGNINELSIDPLSIIDFLVTKLVSGEHTPDGSIVTPQCWRMRVQHALETTKSFYTGCDGFREPNGNTFTGEQHADAYIEPISTLVSRINDVCGEIKEGKALDLGCGIGQYAKLLQKHGFEVELVDYSKSFLKRATNCLGRIQPPDPRDICRLSDYFDPKSFDLIFASASLIHIPPEDIPMLYQTIWNLLTPKGVFFVNYKIGDHTLISLDGRYFAYYSDHFTPKAMLESAGFIIEEIALRINRKNMYSKPKKIHWANYYCRKKS